ncbi:MAG: DUF503 domain-containing protein [Anaerolineaceae bacterium]|jgi:hypothetical protein|nr:MAG: DUF503 domain-containing protein [Anaerolineaceae bacterium]
MHVGILIFRVLLYNSRSLKSKRGQIKPLLNYVHKKFNVSAAEIDLLESWDQSLLACVMVGNERRFLESSLMDIYNDTESHFLNIQFLESKIEIW